MKSIELKVGDKVEINWDKVKESLLKYDLSLSIMDDMKEYYKDKPTKEITKVSGKNLYTKDEFNRYDIGGYVFYFEDLIILQ